MEFWGLEVQPGQTVKVNPGKNKYLHLSQVSLGEIKKEKGAEGASVFVKFDDKKLVLGTLYADKCAQIQHDLVFEKEFELSHGSKNTSVCFLGYKIAVFVESDDESESDEGNPLDVPINGKLEVKRNDKAAMPNAQKAEASDGKSKAKIEKSKKDDKLKAKAEDDDDSEEDESDDDEDDEEMVDGEDNSDDEDESSEEEEEAIPKVEVGNKRPANSSSKTPVPEKKAKLVSSGGNQKSGADGKKGGHIATPYPAKQGKTPANSVDKLKQQAPKPAGSVSCKSCSKTFNSENALQSHTKAKHSGN